MSSARNKMKKTSIRAARTQINSTYIRNASIRPYPNNNSTKISPTHSNILATTAYATHNSPT